MCISHWPNYLRNCKIVCVIISQLTHDRFPNQPIRTLFIYFSFQIRAELIYYNFGTTKCPTIVDIK